MDRGQVFEQGQSWSHYRNRLDRGCLCRQHYQNRQNRLRGPYRKASRYNSKEQGSQREGCVCRQHYQNRQNGVPRPYCKASRRNSKEQGSQPDWYPCWLHYQNQQDKVLGPYREASRRNSKEQGSQPEGWCGTRRVNQEQTVSVPLSGVWVGAYRIHLRCNLEVQGSQ